MWDPNHLEKMGRELKCPICLSLLNSAVSLACNHIFCNSCILKSMKADSACPVCKLPYRRREVRPAPHMDNLVSVYKSMEVASGINIFVTQNASSTKKSDREKQAEAEGDDDHDEQDTGGNCQHRAKKQNTMKGKGSRKTCDSNMKSTVKPSFPAKKRVQVPQHPFPESQERLAPFEGESCEIAKEEPIRNSTILKEKLVLNDKGEPMLSPFFWLREDDGIERSSQHTDEEQLMDMPPVNVPSFSDIKDSDDEYPSNLTPTGGMHGKGSNVADFLDSEMFEWTQRPCSPELCSSPFKMQVADMKDMNGIQENELEADLQAVTTNEGPCTENVKCMNSEPGSGTAEAALPNLSSLRPEVSNDPAESNKSDKSGRIRKTSKRAQKKYAKRNTDSDFRIYVDLNEVSEKFIQEQNCDNGDSMGKTSKRSKKTHFGTSVSKPALEDVQAVSAGTETLSYSEGIVVTETSPSVGKKEGSDEDFTLKKVGKRCKKIDYSVRSDKRKLDSEKDKMYKETSKNQKQKNEDAIPELAPQSICMADNRRKGSDLRQNLNKPGKQTKSSDQELSKKKLKVLSVGILQEALVNDMRVGQTYVPAKEPQLNEGIQGKSDVNVQDDSSVVQKLPCLINRVVLQKCETISNKFQCAFCLSSQELEASGDIVHYYNGRPVAADHEGGIKVIHTHKDCAEWAPNVYFEDEIAINLEAELTRSRRIKCCCCGNKGAALGCYEKSCRKSFHVPCAKLIPQCRWDTVNFVMLCPLHASSKLPSENPGSQERRKQCTPEGRLSQSHCVSSKPNNTGRKWNFCVPSKKLVLCCSALTTPERETISDFERSSGVTVLKKWDTSVTHVIASTDENWACRRTLKVLMGILGGKWILNMEWIKACMKVMELVNEKPYEITVDVHGIREGPQHGRLRFLNKQPKLFNGYKFYLMGDFITSYKGYLQDLIIAAGGTILHRKPIAEDQKPLSGSSTFQSFIICSLELPDKCDPSKKSTILNRRRSDAETLASSTGAKVASNSWLLDSIAACNLQNLGE